MDSSARNTVKVGMVQINNSFSGQNYFPYSVGILQAYAQKNTKAPGRYEFLLPVYKRIPTQQAVEQLLQADVVAFSAYVWNIRTSLEIARRVKDRKPETLIVFGGPHVPDRGDAFMRDNSFIDVACHGEGEAVFLDILEHYPAGDWENVNAVSYRRKGQIVKNFKAARIHDLETIPSPYLDGVFEPLMRANPNERWLMLWETNRGCPFSCTFCDWGSATAAKVFQFDLPRLFREVEWMAEKKIEFVFCCDANYGMLARDLEITRHVVGVRGQYGYPHALSVQNTKNATDRSYQVQKLLSDGGLNKGVTISLQTVDPPTLKAIKRQNISSASFEELQRRFTRDGVETYSDMILGMPEETYDTFASGIAHVIQTGQHNRIQFNNLSILPNAEMGDPDYQKRYGMEIIQSKIINIHGSLNSDDEIQEYQELVIATASMPRDQWRRTRSLCWMTALLYFDKILQIPLVLAHEIHGIGYRELLELFTEGDLGLYPTLRYIRDFFQDAARGIQEGGEEYCRSERWLKIYWPADELVLIHLCTENRLDAFYEEAEDLLCRHVARRQAVHPALREASRLNHRLVKLPFQTEDLDFDTTYNVWEFYRSVLEGRPMGLEAASRVYHVNRTGQRFDTWEEWCRQVVWYGNKKGAYLYANQILERQLDGHF